MDETNAGYAAWRVSHERQRDSQMVRAMASYYRATHYRPGSLHEVPTIGQFRSQTDEQLFMMRNIGPETLAVLVEMRDTLSDDELLKKFPHWLSPDAAISHVPNWVGEGNG